MAEDALHDHPPNMATTGCPACHKDGEATMQRLHRGFADEDAWSLDNFLARLIADTTDFLRDNLNGCPPDLCEGGDVDEGVRRWREILAEIRDGFRAYAEADGFDEKGQVPPGFDHSFDLLRKWWPHLWD